MKEFYCQTCQRYKKIELLGFTGKSNSKCITCVGNAEKGDARTQAEKNKILNGYKQQGKQYVKGLSKEQLKFVGVVEE